MMTPTKRKTGVLACCGRPRVEVVARVRESAIRRRPCGCGVPYSCTVRYGTPYHVYGRHGPAHTARARVCGLDGAIEER